MDPLKTPEDLVMVGDVNLFLKGTTEDEDFEAEVEIMIAGKPMSLVRASG